MSDKLQRPSNQIKRTEVSKLRTRKIKKNRELKVGYFVEQEIKYKFV